MYDTQKRVALAKERIAESRRRGAEPADGCCGNVRGDPAA